MALLQLLPPIDLEVLMGPTCSATQAAAPASPLAALQCGSGARLNLQRKWKHLKEAFTCIGGMDRMARWGRVGRPPGAGINLIVQVVMILCTQPPVLCCA
jgi:hypothetical protein